VLAFSFIAHADDPLCRITSRRARCRSPFPLDSTLGGAKVSLFDQSVGFVRVAL